MKQTKTRLYAFKGKTLPHLHELYTGPK